MGEATETRKRATAVLRLLKWQRVLSPSGIAAWTVLAAIVGGLVSTVEWLQTRKFEAQKPFLEARLKAYIEAIKFAGAVTDRTLDTHSDVWKENSTRFISMRWGELEMLGDAGIRNAARLVVEYIRAAERPEPKFDRRNLRWAVECLADELRFSLEHDWGQTDSNRISVITGKPVSNLPVGCKDIGLHAERRPAMAPFVEDSGGQERSEP
jgi:hypothetical protein